MVFLQVLIPVLFVSTKARYLLIEVDDLQNHSENVLPASRFSAIKKNAFHAFPSFAFRKDDGYLAEATGPNSHSYLK